MNQTQYTSPIPFHHQPVSADILQRAMGALLGSAVGDALEVGDVTLVLEDDGDTAVEFVADDDDRLLAVAHSIANPGQHVSGEVLNGHCLRLLSPAVLRRAGRCTS